MKTDPVARLATGATLCWIVGVVFGVGACWYWALAGMTLAVAVAVVITVFVLFAVGAILSDAMMKQRALRDKREASHPFAALDKTDGGWDAPTTRDFP